MMKKRPLYVIPLVLLIQVYPTLANETPPGWRWYNEPKPALQAPKVEPLPSNTQTTISSPKTLSATEQMDWFHTMHKEAQNDAAIHPKDKEKLARFLALNRFITDQTDQLGMTFKALLLEKPELSYTKEHPTEQAARQVYLDLENQKKTDAVEKMKREGWGFFFVYDGKDKLSQQLAPSIQAFADQYHFELLGISNDETFITNITVNRHNQGKISVPFTPALILVHPSTGEMKPLAYGWISQNELLGRFYNVATNFEQSDF
ncbi:type-F conjugative transfer system pilin assembly protein TraF [Vibrio vulnificus]|nr:type-F conjugative transfer system pilin assembly protein TraF [Vibrio vulnificus]EGQ8079041.1 type-F conjugative transfer system pilin assembly protein TraF [Vibrio vulnificus]EGQ9240137.1 type-F conjugative transfer system pilin assembly protein TraF [Vibrio vulnificus]EGR0637317.1 type-F conjugative transfer system pilin assembly protein TraF [Vibrio vulnificus]EHD1698665.1 type-F conjugative transfer system pilin assembly protein TraF [Vibrio vulnificus]